MLLIVYVPLYHQSYIILLLVKSLYILHKFALQSKAPAMHQGSAKPAATGPCSEDEVIDDSTNGVQWMKK